MNCGRGLKFVALALLTFCAHREACGITKGDNGTLGSYRRQPSTEGTPITIEKGNTVAGLGLFFPHSSIVAQGGNRITDTQFATLLTNNLGTGIGQTQDSLVIHMAQCYSGGFIDEVEDAMFRTEINTAAWWGVPSWGTASGPNAKNQYSSSWLQGHMPPATGAELAAYTLGVGNDPTANQERPQYYSTSDTMDGLKLGQPAFAGALDKKYALLFVGDDRDWNNTTKTFTRANRHWNDAVKYRQFLISSGIPSANIYVYYNAAPGAGLDMGKPAGGVGSMFVDGPASTANFNDFFNAVVKNNVAGQNDQVLVWTSDHGSLQNDFVGKVQFIFDGVKNTVKMKTNLTVEMLNGFTQAIWDNAFIEGDPLNNLGLGELVNVYLGSDTGSIKELVGTIAGTVTGSSSPWNFGFDGDLFKTLATEFSAMSQTSGDLAFYFEGGNSQTQLNDFLWGVNGQPIPAPEPATVTLLSWVAILGWRRRRTAA